MAYKSNSRAEKPAHEVLGVERGSDLIQIASAYSALSGRWAPEKNPGDELAALRHRRITDAFREMCAAQGFYPYEAYAAIPPVKQPEFNNHGQRMEHFNMRTRVVDLVSRFNDYLELSACNIDAVKRDSGLRFTFLKAVLRRRDEDRAVYDAERTLRHAQAEVRSEQGLCEIKTMLSGFVMNVDAGRVDRILPKFLERVEKAVEERTQAFKGGLAVLQGAGGRVAP